MVRPGNPHHDGLARRGCVKFALHECPAYGASVDLGSAIEVSEPLDVIGAHEAFVEFFVEAAVVP